MLIPDIITILVLSVAVVAITATAAVLGSVLVVVLVAAVYFIVIIKFLLLLTVMIDWRSKLISLLLPTAYLVQVVDLHGVT